MTDLERRLASPASPALDPVRVTAELARRADAEGLLDVAWATLDTPLGPIAVFVTPRGVVRVAYDRENFAQVADEVAERVSPRVLLAPERTDAVRKQLDAYFEKGRREFDLAIDWTLVRGFNQGVLQATAAIPYGEVASYGEVAAAAGSPRAARAAGNALAGNPIPIVVPCHRVIHADGGLGGYTGGLETKRFLLKLEGGGNLVKGNGLSV
jgi:methylated-DNA-[protein]-cysteine S-methyltransferase